MSNSASAPGDVSSKPAMAPRGTGIAQEVRTLTTVIKQLEEQLDQMMAANEALRKDFQEERARRLAHEGSIDELNQKLRHAERVAADKENLLAEVKHVNQERVRLGTSTRELGERLREAIEQRDAEAQKVERLRVAHANAVEEVQSVEAQFERAMQVVAQTRAQLAIAVEERDQHALRAKTSEALLNELRNERDALVSEVEQSRSALDEIRQSLVDVALVSAHGEQDPQLRGSDGLR